MRIATHRRGGRVVHRHEAGEFVVSDIEYPAGSLLGRHRHSGPYISVLLDGAYTELCGGVPHACAPGTVIVHPGSEEHADYFVSAGRCINIDIPQTWLDRGAERFERRLLQVCARTDWRVRFLGAVARERDSLRVTTLEQTLRGLATVATPNRADRSSRSPAWLTPLLETFPWVEPVPLGRAARWAGVHQAHFSRAFRHHVGMSPGEYRARCRLRNASRLLLESSASLTDIAQACGFSDQSHFANAFRITAGMPPGGFRSAFSA